MSKKRRKWLASEKTAVVLDLLQGDETVGQVAARYEVHPHQLAGWRRQFLEGASMVFEADKAARDVVIVEAAHGKEVDNLNRIIGQLTVERDYLQRRVQEIIGRRGS